jgi:phage terminase large subunit
MQGGVAISTPNEKSVFDEWLERYSPNPVLFVQEVLGADPDPWQQKFMMAVAEGKRRISIRSGHGVGKSTAVSWLMLWFLLTKNPCKVVVTAPTAPQLFDALFAELKRWVKELPPAIAELVEAKQERVEFVASPESAFISARTSRAEQPEALAGIHSENVLLVADEASGVPEQVFEAASGSMSGHNACTILIGNPVRGTGYFYDTHHKLSGEWWTMRVSCEDSPRVSKEFIREIAMRYGEESNVYRVRVLGEFPKADDDTVIPYELIEAATVRDVVANPDAAEVWGLDVARFGTDSSCLVKRKANVILGIQTWRNLDLMTLTGAVVAEYNAADKKPVEILVDSIGLGAGVVDRLQELKLPARGINVAESPAMGNTYANLRAELWYKTKAWLEKRDCKIPNNERLVGELAAIRYGFMSTGKLKIESKEEMRKRGLPSPDVADALVLTFSSDAGVALYGTSYTSTWNKPIKRNLATA